MALDPGRVLLRGGCVYSPARPGATAMLTVGRNVVWVGDDTEAAGAVTARAEPSVGVCAATRPDCTAVGVGGRCRVHRS